MKGGCRWVKNYELLVRQAIKGDATAFEKLLIHNEKKMYYTALSYVRKKEDALDVIQETAYKAFIAIDQLREPKYFSTWITKILIRECYQLLRKRNKMIPYDEEKLRQKLHSIDLERTDHLLLRELIHELPSNYQTVIILFYFHDLSIEDISVITERPVGTVKTHLYRARKNLKKRLEGSYPFNEGAT